MITGALIQHSLLYGAILSGVMFAIILGSLAYNPELWLNDFPPDIRAKYGPASEKTKRQKKWVAPLFLMALLGIMVASLIQVPRLSGGQMRFLPAFVHLYIVFLVFNLVDLLVIDWLIGIVLRPRFTILPGTEGMAGYRDYAYHLRAFGTGMVGGLVASLVLAAVAASISALLS
jgi:hypothetical protein